MNRFRTFLRMAESIILARTLRKMRNYREGGFWEHADPKIQERPFAPNGRLEEASSVASADDLKNLSQDETFEELVGFSKRDINSDKPTAALTRFFTYCAAKFGHLRDV